MLLFINYSLFSLLFNVRLHLHVYDNNVPLTCESLSLPRLQTSLTNSHFPMSFIYMHVYKYIYIYIYIFSLVHYP